MPAITLSGMALRDEYRNERRIEMEFEEQRYHDARRWMIAATTLERKLQFINVSGILKPGATAPISYRHDETIYTYNYVSYNPLAELISKCMLNSSYRFVVYKFV